MSAFFVERAKKLFHDLYGDTIKDSWCVYEWQGRGSVHLHCLLWMADVPPLPCVGDVEQAWRAGKLAEGVYNEQLRTWATYYAEYISAFNPAVVPQPPSEGSGSSGPGAELESGPFADRCREYEGPYYANPPVESLPKLKKHVCAHQFGELPEVDDWMYLANFCNCHTRCRPGVCLKVDKRTKQEYCKNGTPWTRSSVPRFARSTKYRGELEFVPVRNDPLMNAFS